jgi:nucleotide-binding universal stress UspA family protein
MTLFPTKILLATEGPGAGRPAVQAAVELANRTGSELHVVCVEEVPLTAGVYAAAQGVSTPDTEGDRELLQEQAREIEEAGGSVSEAHPRVGIPAQEIIELSEEIGAGLLVVGNRGLSGAQRLILGSVSEAAVRYAPCPVLVVRDKDPSRDGGE